jgi:hypothetical protein
MLSYIDSIRLFPGPAIISGKKGMADCPNLRGCAFFNDRMPGESGLGSMYKKNFCLGEYSMCARFMVSESLGKEKIPENLYPNMADRAKQLIAQG